MEETPPRRGPGNLEPSFPGATARPPTHHLGRGQHQDDESHLTRVLPPVLWANQPADAHVPLLQGLGGTAAGVGRARSTQLVVTLGAGLPEPLSLTPPVTSLRERKRPNGTECPHPLPSDPGGGQAEPRGGPLWCPGNSHDADPGLLVLHPCGRGSDPLDGV